MWKKEQKERIRRAFLGWIKAFQIPIKETIFNWEKQDKTDDKGMKTQFEISNGFPYMSCSLTCYPIAAKETYDYLEMGLIHECQHLILSPITENRTLADSIFQNYEEQVVEGYTKYIWDLTQKCRSLETENRRLKRENNKLTQKHKIKKEKVK